MARLHYAPCGHIAFGDDHTIQEVNLEAERLLGSQPRQLVGQPIGEVFTPRTRVFFSAHVFPALSLRGVVEEAYVSLRKADGQEIATLMNVVRRLVDGEQLIECAFMPMQRRRLFEQELIERRRAAVAAARAEQAALSQLKTAQSQLAAQHQLASLGMLAAGVAHEINNPLSYVAGNLELIDRRFQQRAADPELQAMLAEATQGVLRIRDIVRSLRRLSRVEQPDQRTPVDVREVVDVSARLAGSQISHQARFDVAVPSESLIVDADAGRLGQVVLNLLVNAAQAVPEGGKDNHIRLSARREADEVVIEVEDNGPGIEAEAMSRIFDPFYTTKPVGLGTGLGLSVCKGIVTALGGTIDVRTAPGQGACFRVALPLSAAHSAPSKSEPPAIVARPAGEEPAQASRPRVLIIDDDPHVTRVIALALRQFEITIINHSPDALDVLAKQDFDVVLCDLMMPKVTGIDIHRELTRSNPLLAQRMIFLTGGSFSPDTDAFLATVTNPCLRKPFPTALLCRACTEMASKHAPGLGSST